LEQKRAFRKASKETLASAPSLLANPDAPSCGTCSFLRFSFKAAPLGGNLGNLSVSLWFLDMVLLRRREMGEASLARL
jgi:hypothetical protein